MLPNTKEAIFIAGPSGKLEALINLPRDSNNLNGCVVICHPHPLKDGTMHNKVVHYLAKTFNDCGYAAVRFNYRGVGLSDGVYDNANGESADALAVYDWTKAHLNELPIWFAGFSFGSYVALRCSTQRDIAGLITIAPAVNLLDFRSLALPTTRWLMLHGDKDEIVPINDALAWRDTLSRKPELITLNEAGHFFHGKLNELRDNVARFIEQQPAS